MKRTIVFLSFSFVCLAALHGCGESGNSATGSSNNNTGGAGGEAGSGGSTSSSSSSGGGGGGSTPNDCVNSRIVPVTDGAELQTALQNAAPCDIIELAPGTYTTSTDSETVDDGLGDTVTRSWYFRAAADGKPGQPIIVRSKDASNPSEIVGSDWQDSGYGLYITGDHWRMENIKVSNAAKGVMLDNANFVVLTKLEVFDIGQEGIHLRDGSSNNLVEDCNLHDIGRRNDGFGEGIYVGSDNSVWKEGDGNDTGENGLLYSRDCHDNTIRGCQIGPNVTAEPFDIKEGTTNTIVEKCNMDGPGVSGSLFADSFVDIKGCQAIIRYNTFTQGGNSTITRGVMIVSRQNAGVADEFTARDNYVHDNVFNVEASTYMGYSYKGSANIYMWNNTKVPNEGETYTDLIIQSAPPGYSPPGP